MVKLAGPCMSMSASGKLANAIVFSRWKGRPYARQLVIPANPQSGGQTGVRRMMRFLSQDWTNLLAAESASWEDRADERVISPFNAFVGVNMERWRNFNGPGISDPIGDTGAVGTLANEAATAGVRQITIDWDVTIVAGNWGVMVFRSQTLGFGTMWTNLVHCIRALTVASFSWIDTPLAAGTYYYNFRAFTTDGVIGAETGEVNATVT